MAGSVETSLITIPGTRRIKTAMKTSPGRTAVETRPGRMAAETAALMETVTEIPGIMATLTAVRMPEGTIPMAEILLEEAASGRTGIPPESVSEGQF